MKQLFVVCCLIFFSAGCFRHEYKKPIANGYYLYAYAADEDMSIMHFDNYGGMEIINPTVFSIGYDKDFIIAKQHPAIYPEKENRHVTNYFIIPLKQPVKWTDDSVAIGPLKENEFQEIRKKLKIADTLSFFINFNSIK
ncbi:MAG TPA: hypothetical protein VGI61_01885 [Parafilimonas sp.]|jgi:hypothetical protein